MGLLAIQVAAAQGFVGEVCQDQPRYQVSRDGFKVNLQGIAGLKIMQLQEC